MRVRAPVATDLLKGDVIGVACTETRADRRCEHACIVPVSLGQRLRAAFEAGAFGPLGDAAADAARAVGEIDGREPLTHAGQSGTGLERIVMADGRRLVVKRLS